MNYHLSGKDEEEEVGEMLVGGLESVRRLRKQPARLEEGRNGGRRACHHRQDGAEGEASWEVTEDRVGSL